MNEDWLLVEAEEKDKTFIPPLRCNYHELKNEVTYLKNHLIIEARDYIPGSDETMGSAYHILVEIQ